VRAAGCLAAVVALLAAALLVPRLLEPPPAAERLAGVSVRILDARIRAVDDQRTLGVDLVVESPSDLQACLGFALDQPLASRRLRPTDGGCVQPRSGTRRMTLVLDRLTDTDLAFPEHTLVWGVDRGRCGPLFELVGVCVIEAAGTVPLRLPVEPPLPSMPPP
jgi:hypothetical protein